MTAELITNEEFWNSTDMVLRLRRKTVRQRLDGIQYHLQFVNGYGMSILNGAGMGVEVMILDAEDGTVAGGDVPVEALLWVREMLADDVVITHLSPAELRNVIHDVAHWPDLHREEIEMDYMSRLGQQIKSDHFAAYHSGEWGTIIGAAQGPGISDCWSIEWPNGDVDVWQVHDELANYEFRDAV